MGFEPTMVILDYSNNLKMCKSPFKRHLTCRHNFLFTPNFYKSANHFGKKGNFRCQRCFWKRMRFRWISKKKKIILFKRHILLAFEMKNWTKNWYLLWSNFVQLSRGEESISFSFFKLKSNWKGGYGPRSSEQKGFCNRKRCCYALTLTQGEN